MQEIADSFLTILLLMAWISCGFGAIACTIGGFDHRLRDKVAWFIVIGIACVLGFGWLLNILLERIVIL